jgi:hypothetical protein
MNVSPLRNNKTSLLYFVHDGSIRPYPFLNGTIRLNTENFIKSEGGGVRSCAAVSL